MAIVTEAHRRGILAETFDVDVDAELLEEEASVLADAMLDLDPVQNNAEDESDKDA